MFSELVSYDSEHLKRNMLHTHGPCQIPVCERYSFGPSCCPACMEDEGNIIWLCCSQTCTAFTPEFPTLLDVQHNLTSIPVAFGNCSIVFSGCFHGTRILCKCSLGYQRQGRFQIVNIKFEFTLFVARI